MFACGDTDGVGERRGVDVVVGVGELETTSRGMDDEDSASIEGDVGDSPNSFRYRAALAGLDLDLDHQLILYKEMSMTHL